MKHESNVERERTRRAYVKTRARAHNGTISGLEGNITVLREVSYTRQLTKPDHGSTSSGD